MIYVVFFHALEYPEHIVHCGIWDESRDALTIWSPHVDYGFHEHGVCGLLTVFKLPISFKPLVTKRKQLGMVDYPRGKERARNPIDFPFRVYMKQAMSCSHLVAYLLGLEEFWYYKPDEIYEVLFRYTKPVYHKLHIGRWKKN